MNVTPAQELAVLQSVTYASLFDYPLTLAQLRESLIGLEADESTILSWWRHSALLQAVVDYRDGLFFPAGRTDLVPTRARREALSRDLLHRDRRVCAMVAGLPFVRMVALSGSLAHLNAERSADVDLFVITAANRVWFVTVVALLVSKIMGWRQRLCLNYVVSEQDLAIAPADLFSANQIIHLRPVMGWATYQRFVDANPFVARTYPNFGLGVRPSAISDRRWWLTVVEHVLALGVAPLAEQICRAAYRWHLSKRSARWRSGDQVRLDDGCLKLHTSSHREETMERFEEAVASSLAGAQTRPFGSSKPDSDSGKEDFAAVSTGTRSTDEDTAGSTKQRKQA